GQKAAPIRPDRARPADLFPVEGTGGVSGGQGLRPAGRGRLAGLETRWSFVCRHQLNEAFARGFSVAGNTGDSFEPPLGRPRTLCSAAARFPCQRRGAGLFEDGLDEDWVTPSYGSVLTF